MTAPSDLPPGSIIEVKDRPLLVRKPTDAELRNRFFYHPPTADTLPRFATVNEACFVLAKTLVDTVPEGRGLSLALTHLEDVRMRANFGIATETSEAVTPVKP